MAKKDGLVGPLYQGLSEINHLTTKCLYDLTAQTRYKEEQAHLNVRDSYLLLI